MSENTVNTSRRMKLRHRGRGAQVWIYLGKMLRMFVYQNDWKVLPMAALIAGLVGMVIRKRLFLNMEGSLMGAFAMVMVCIWNGCFNSIQVICRERDVIKREHRSGMHISSYIFSHMLYQALLCLLQTGVTLYVTLMVGVRYDLGTPLFTPFFIVDYGISMFLITYASDMLSLWVSAIAHSTTTAMTIMPFVLIFQLVFSGGMLALPAWSEPLTHFTISNPGLKVLAAQSDYNSLPLVTIWNTLSSMKNSEVSGTITLGQAMDFLTDQENPAAQELRALEVGKIFTVGELAELLENSETFQSMKGETVLTDLTVGKVLSYLNKMEELKPYLERSVIPGAPVTFGGLLNGLLNEQDFSALLSENVASSMTLGEILDAVDAQGLVEQYRDLELGGTATVGEIADAAAANADIQKYRDKGLTINTTVGKLLDALGRDRVREVLESKAAEASHKPEYDNTQDNIVNYWRTLLGFVLAFAALSTITLEFIDKDRR